MSTMIRMATPEAVDSRVRAFLPLRWRLRSSVPASPRWDTALAAGRALLRV
jgi:hypothetical protein